MKILKTYVQSAISPDQSRFDTVKKGIAYKVFKVKHGKLYPPMVANAGGVDTPVGVWLDAEEGEFAGLSKTGRPQVKQSKGNQTLSYRPGWHLGDIPRASQFDRTVSFVEIEPTEDTVVTNKVGTLSTFFNSYLKPKNLGNAYYIKDIDAYVQIVDDDAPYLPYDFIWAECEYIMEIDYQDEAYEQGWQRTKIDDKTGEVIHYRGRKYQHSLAGLQHLPTDGFYRYRTNPDPDTVPWVITGQMRVSKLLSDDEVNKVLQQNGVAPIHRQGGDLTLDEIMSL